MVGSTRGRDTNRLSLDDLPRFALIDDIALSPEGDRVAMTVRTTDRASNRDRAAITLVASDGSSSQALPSGAYDDHTASWSPDGTRLAFVSNRGGTEQVWLHEGDGEARQITFFPLGVRGPAAWSPDGRFLAVVVTTQTLAQDQPPAILTADGPPFTVTEICYRADGQGYLGGRGHNIWIVDVENCVATQLTDGNAATTSPTWSPDGSQIAFIANRDDERLLEFRSSVWTVAVRGGEPIRITPATGVASAPAWSPDGREVAYIGLLPGKAFAPNHHVLLVPADGRGTPRSLTSDFVGHVGSGLFSDMWQPGKAPTRLFWTPDGHVVRFLAAVRARVHVFETSRDGTVRPLVEGDRACGQLQVSRDGRTLAYAAADFLRPHDLYVATPAEGAERRLSHLNPWLDAIRLSEPRPIAVTGVDGLPIDAWLIPPSGATEPTPAPLVLDVHGGPHSIFGHVFFFDMQLLAAEGYSVLFANPRATRGYGDHFSSCNVGHWGEGDAPDLLAALDAALATGWVDPNRVGVIGLSYGGYMTNWLVGHSDRFRAAISENSISNLVSFYGTADIGWYFLPEEMDAEPDAELERYIRLSPLSAASQIKTPLLFLNTLEDWRCPIEQAEQLYTALKRRSQTVEMVCFPGESHAMLANGKPLSRLTRRQHMLRWLATYLR